jgi:hypothetical protein
MTELCPNEIITLTDVLREFVHGFSIVWVDSVYQRLIVPLFYCDCLLGKSAMPMFVDPYWYFQLLYVVKVKITHAKRGPQKNPAFTQVGGTLGTPKSLFIK